MKTKNLFTLAALFSATFAFSEEAAQSSLSQADVDEQNRLSDPEAVVSASDQVEEWKEDALRQLKGGEGVTPDGKYVIFASANVSIPQGCCSHRCCLAQLATLRELRSRVPSPRDISYPFR